MQPTGQQVSIKCTNQAQTNKGNSLELSGLSGWKLICMARIGCLLIKIYFLFSYLKSFFRQCVYMNVQGFVGCQPVKAQTMAFVYIIEIKIDYLWTTSHRSDDIPMTNAFTLAFSMCILTIWSTQHMEVTPHTHTNPPKIISRYIFPFNI